MSRSTQYIGLTRKAEEIVKDAELLENEGYITTGMLDEIIQLSAWLMEDGDIYYEVVQASPWSSGPMIFTCLARYEGEEETFADDELTKIPESLWKEERPEGATWHEANKEEGLFWV